MRLALSFAALLLSILLSSCGSGRSNFDVDAVRPVIEAKTNQFTEAHITGDSVFLKNIFTEDARVYAPNSGVVEGRQAIARVNAEYLSYGIQEFREQSTALYGSENYLIDEGTYILRYGPDNTTERGRYLNIWKEEANDWLLYANMWTTESTTTPTQEEDAEE